LVSSPAETLSLFLSSEAGGVHARRDDGSRAGQVRWIDAGYLRGSYVPSAIARTFTQLKRKDLYMRFGWQAIRKVIQTATSFEYRDVERFPQERRPRDPEDYPERSIMRNNVLSMLPERIPIFSRRNF